MSTATVNREEVAEAADPPIEYLSIHAGAVLGLILGGISVVTWFTAGSDLSMTMLLAPIPLLGLVVSLSAWRTISGAREVYTGALMAKVGAALSAFFLGTGVGYASYVYVTEVPDGYARTSFIEMKPSEKDVVDRKLIPDDIFSAIKNDEKVFIKGYIRPDSITFTKNLRDFLLVRDNQQCCFGDLSKVKYFDQIQVRLGPGLTTDFSRGVFRLGGKMKVGPPNPELGTPLTYELDADYIR